MAVKRALKYDVPALGIIPFIEEDENRCDRLFLASF